MAVRLALIGCGGISQQHLNGYTAIKAAEPDLFELVATCDADRERAEAAAAAAAAWQQAPPRVYTDVAELLDCERLDAADICTPHFLHHTVGDACLAAGVHVQIEKPIGVTVRATRQLIEAARRSGKILATAENVRRMPGPRTAHWLFHERGLLGAPAALYSQRVATPRRPRAGQPPAPGAAGAPVEPPWVWRMDRALSGGGPVLDSGAHFCDTIRYLYGDVESCYGRVLQLRERKARRGDALVPVETEDTFLATLNFAGGAVGFWSVSTALPGHQIATIAYYGRDGAIVEPRDPFHGPTLAAQVTLRDGEAQPLETYYHEYLDALGEAGRQRLFPHGLTDGFALEVYDFLTAVRDNRPPEIDGEAGLRAKAIALAIYESATTGQVVRVDDVLAGRARDYQRPIDGQWGL